MTETSIHKSIEEEEEEEEEEMPTLFTDPRSGGVKKSSGVNVLPIVQESK